MNQATTTYPVDKERKYICKPAPEITIPESQAKEQKQQRKFHEGKIVRARHHIGRPVQSTETRPLTPPLTRYHINERPGSRANQTTGSQYKYRCTCNIIPDLPVPTVATVPAGNLIEQTHIDLLVVSLIYPPLKPTKRTLIEI